MMEAEQFFGLEEPEIRALFPIAEPVWKALDGLQDFLEGYFREPWPLSGVTGPVTSPLAIHDGKVLEGVDIRTTGQAGAFQAWRDGRALDGAAVLLPGAYLVDDRVLLGAGTVVEPGAMVRGPTVIGKGTEVRQGAYVRGNCWVGDKCVVGHATEMKSSIMLHGAKAGHFAYVGDSILGRDVNLGAGTKLANLKMIGGTISVVCNRERIDTGRRKVGAILGDGTETGCNSVTSPGTFMGPRSLVYPAVTVPGGVYTKRTIVSVSRSALKVHQLNSG